MLFSPQLGRCKCTLLVAYDLASARAVTLFIDDMHAFVGDLLHPYDSDRKRPA